MLSGVVSLLRRCPIIRRRCPIILLPAVPIIGNIGQSAPSPVGAKLTSALTVIVQPSRLPRPDDTSVAAMTPSMRSAHGCCGNTPTRLDWTRHSRDLFAAYLAAKQRQHVAGGEWWPASPAALSPLPTSRRRPSGRLPASLSDSGDHTIFRSHASLIGRLEVSLSSGWQPQNPALPRRLSKARLLVAAQALAQCIRCPIMRVQRGHQPSAAVSDNSSLGCPIIDDIGQSAPRPVGAKLTSALTVIVQPSRQPRPGDNSVAAMTSARRSLAITRKNRAAWSNTNSTNPLLRQRRSR